MATLSWFFPDSAPPPRPPPVWAGPCRGLCLSPSFDMRPIMVRRGNTALLTSLSILPPPPPECHAAAKQSKSMEGELSEGCLRRSDTAADSSSVRGCRRRGGGAGVLTDSSWGRLSPLVTFPVGGHDRRGGGGGEASGGLSGPEPE